MPTREEIQNRVDVMTAWLGGTDVQFLGRHIRDDVWIDLKGSDCPSFNFDRNKYRIKPVEPDYIDWSHVSSIFNFMARTKRGVAHLYNREPSVFMDGWVLNGPGARVIPACNFESMSFGGMDWKDSLIKRPGAV